MSKVVLKGVEKQYPNGFKAVHGIDLDIKDGEFMVFVGPSGCAKSTTLRMIAGLEEITGGEVYIGDKLVNDVPPKDRGIAMVFQNYALYPHMTVYENMAFGLKLKKTPKEEIDKRVKEAAEKLEITELLDRKPKEMSGGQRQRVALGRAIVRKPEVFLFDEPLSNLDAKLRVSMRVRITQLHQELKTTVMKSGRIMQVDTPLNLYHYPANKFVAGFIGSPTMNLVEGTVVEKEGKVFIDINGAEIEILGEKAEKVKGHAGKKVTFGIRPESISVAEAEDNISKVGEVSVVEQMGNEEYIYFTLNGHQMTCRINVAGVSDSVGKKGQKIFRFDTSKAHIFDIETEENISL